MTQSSTGTADLLALAETIHKARFPADRTPTPFETQDASGREYCLRIARSIMAEHGIPAQLTPRPDLVKIANEIWTDPTFERIYAALRDAQHMPDRRGEIASIFRDYLARATGETLVLLQDILHDVDEALSTVPAQSTQWQPISTWVLSKHGRHIIGQGTDFGPAEYCWFDNGGWHVASFNGQILQRDPCVWQPLPRSTALPSTQSATPALSKHNEFNPAREYPGSYGSTPESSR